MRVMMTKLKLTVNETKTRVSKLPEWRENLPKTPVPVAFLLMLPNGGESVLQALRNRIPVTLRF
jgi:hypothetical protein